jgi:hypothetical protein
MGLWLLLAALGDEIALIFAKREDGRHLFQRRCLSAVALASQTNAAVNCENFRKRM